MPPTCAERDPQVPVIDVLLLRSAGFRQTYEPLWLQYGVDLLFSGHVHAYERSNPVANYSVDPSGCAPVQLIVGDGGNHEGVRTRRLPRI